MKVTCSAGGIVMNNKGLVLVVRQGGNSWSLPKGHMGLSRNEQFCFLELLRKIYSRPIISSRNILLSWIKIVMNNYF